jgi:ATP-binding cassette subfamily B (MDR/TAP) protein 1
MHALFRQPVTTIDLTSAGVIASRLTTNSNTIESGISQQFSLGIQAIAFTLGLYIVAFSKSVLLTLVATSSVPVVIIAYAIAMPLMNKFWNETEAIKDQASSLAFEIFQSIRIVVAFGAENKLGSRHARLLKQAEIIERKHAPVMGLMLAPIMIGLYGVFAMSFWFGIKQYIGGKIDGANTIVGE